MPKPWEQYAAQASPSSSDASGPWTKYAPKEAAAEPESKRSSFAQGAVDLGAGLVRGAGSIGSTLLAPIDMISDAMEGKGWSLESNRQRRRLIDEGLTSLVGSDPNSALYQTGKIGGEIAGTAGAGGALGNAVARITPNAPALATALRTGGFRTGNTPTTALGKAADIGTRAAGGAATGAVSAGLIDPEYAPVGAVVGGVLPGAIGAAGKIAQGVGSAAKTGATKLLGGQVSDDVAGLAKRAKELGIDIPADRLTDSKPLNAVAAGLNYVPFSGRSATEDLMTTQLNQALSRTFGQDSSNVTKALRKANDELGAKFDHTLRNNGVAFDKTLLDDVTNVFNTAERELGSDSLKAISSQVDELIKKGESGVIDGQAAYNIKRTLDRIGRQNTPASYHAIELKQALMNALDRSLGPEKAAAFAKTRQQYGNMLSLEKLAKNGVDGEISAARLANMKNINNPELQELADISAQFVRGREGQHGAAQRAFAGLGIGSFAGPTGLAGTAAAGRVANSALNSNSLKSLLLNEPVQPGPLSNLLRNDKTQQSILRVSPVLAAESQ